MKCNVSFLFSENSIPMKKITPLLAITILGLVSFAPMVLISEIPAPFIPYYTLAPGGDITNPAIWSNTSHSGPGSDYTPCTNDPCQINSGKYIYIAHPVTLSCDLVLDGNATIIVESGGTLFFTESASVSGTGNFQVNPGGSVEVVGSLNLIGTGNVTIDGSLDVSGNLTIDGAATFCGSGIVSVAGNVYGTPDPCFSGVLPVELISFNAIANDSVVEIDWSTASQLNNDYFTIERSATGENFSPILKVKGAGTTNQQIDYFERDNSPLPGISYYRLKQTDFNGTYSYSEVVAVKRNITSAGLSVYPNPANTDGSLFIAFSEFMDQEVLVVIRDITGRKFYSKLIILAENNQIVAFDPDQKTPPGTYLIVASSEDELYRKKLIVK